MKKQHISLSVSDQSYLEGLLSKGSLPVKVYQRSQALLLWNAGKTYSEVGKVVFCDYQTVSGWAKRYKQDGLAFLEDAPRWGRPAQIRGVQQAKITALACSTPADGQVHWSLRLLSEQVGELGDVEQISHTYVGQVLKKMTWSLTSKNSGVWVKSMGGLSVAWNGCYICIAWTTTQLILCGVLMNALVFWLGIELRPCPWKRGKSRTLRLWKKWFVWLAHGDRTPNRKAYR